MVVKTIFV